MATMVHQSHTNELRHSLVVRRPALIKPCGPWRFLRQSPNEQSSASNIETAERWRQKRSPEISLTELGVRNMYFSIGNCGKMCAGVKPNANARLRNL
jgi:hypothetical protein